MNFQHSLIEVRPEQKEAVFALLGDSDKQGTTTVKVRCVCSTILSPNDTVNFNHRMSQV